MAERQLRIEKQRQGFRASFLAMGSPCEVLCHTDREADAAKLAQRAADEAWRVEDKFSRYLDGNIVARLNRSNNETIEVDAETARLLDFADHLYELSGSMFDITSGVLREVWSFDGSDDLPTAAAVAAIMQRVGWHLVSWREPFFSMPAGMQIDFGGLGKEYSVDNAIRILRETAGTPCLINFGGDLAVTGPPDETNVWSVGIEGAQADSPDKMIELRQGALATSGDARRHIDKNGIRYGHILDPRTGYPVAGAPSSVTVAADTCTQAGMLSTLAMLKGPTAEQFLRAQKEQSWCRRN